jgi:hypothetical protein
MIRRAVLVLLVAVAGSCVNDELEKARIACNLRCDRLGAASLCGDLTTFVTECKAECRRIVPLFDEECKDIAEESYGCDAVLNWRCPAGQTEPAPTTTGCESSRADLAVCLEGIGE